MDAELVYCDFHLEVNYTHFVHPQSQWHVAAPEKRRDGQSEMMRSVVDCPLGCLRKTCLKKYGE
jgi:hypothetical protein